MFFVLPCALVVASDCCIGLSEHKSVCRCRCVDIYSPKGRSLFDHLSAEETLLNRIQNMTDKVIVYGGRGGLGIVIVDAFKV